MARRQVGWPYKKEFTCHRCGNCCRGDGFVEMSEDDIVRAAWLLDVTEEEFVAKYCEHSPGGGEIFLKDQQDDLQSCIFLIEDDKFLIITCLLYVIKMDRKLTESSEPRNLFSQMSFLRCQDCFCEWIKFR